MQTQNRPPCRSSKASRGVLLIEILVALAIVAVLGCLVLPAFQQMLREYRLRVAAQDLSSQIAWTRSEALRRSGRVTLRFTPLSDCPNGLPAGAKYCGWRIYQEADGQLLHQHLLPRGIHISEVNSAGGDDVNFTGSDMDAIPGLGIKSFVLSAEGASGDRASRILCMSSGGRVRIAAAGECKA
ncbi:hypothetical protein GT347_00595 [Xylophilus rhododendri]|uniref:Type II secretion system protein H n=1 Tax=Xylophilus rhododendri TaxID=2697032 RepID=A0A857IYU6_9BURK|nr:GspH/FimT family pseudopilin [Xylophilus rhododendri]QHI96626.1 hypothetical protein GT347_00595 [Xylophilus rhododendri]